MFQRKKVDARSDYDRMRRTKGFMRPLVDELLKRRSQNKYVMGRLWETQEGRGGEDDESCFILSRKPLCRGRSTVPCENLY